MNRLLNLKWNKVLSIGAVFVWPGLVCADELVDPRWPSEWRTMQAAENRPLSPWLPECIRQLEAERDQLLATISTLPQFDPALISDRLGYHSGYVGQEGSSSDHQLTVHFKTRPRLGAIALVPTINPRDRHGDSYAFPPRFKIEVLETTGPPETETREWVEVANWMEEDFPNPGRYPVFFHANHGKVAKVRMSVPRAESGPAFYALGEIFLFQSVEGQIADNMSVWGRTSIEEFEVSDSFSLAPFWDVGYLYDGFAGLGAPLSEEQVEVNDFFVRFDDDDGGVDHKPVQIILDLGITQRVGRVEIWPTEAPHHIAAPLYAFPGKVLVELSNEPDFNETKTVVVDDARAQMYHDNLLRIMCDAHESRYIRLTLDGLRKENGRKTLGIGEVSVSEHGKVFSVGCAVSATGIPVSAEGQLARLVDGTCRGRRILSETDWIMGLAKRRPLDLRLEVVEEELASARTAWRALQLRLGIWGGSLLCIGLLIAMGLQRLQRRRILKGLKLRITRDLHDEVGSGLGGISLTSEGLEKMADDEALKSELGELSLMARETCASLREVVWLTDQDAIRLPALIGKLVERAERVLHGVELESDVSRELPDMEVSLPCKRHLLMIFRETIHNCARHAEATKVHLSARIVEQSTLEVLIKDDGCGFDGAEIQKGWGLDSMKRRAEELHGKLELCSRPGEGTLVCLTVPLTALSKDPKRAYKTSN